MIIFIIFSGWRLSIFWERIQLLMKKSKRNIFTAQTRKLNSTQYVINWLKNHFNQSREIGHLIYFMYSNFFKKSMQNWFLATTLHMGWIMFVPARSPFLRQLKYMARPVTSSSQKSNVWPTWNVTTHCKYKINNTCICKNRLIFKNKSFEWLYLRLKLRLILKNTWRN